MLLNLWIILSLFLMMSCQIGLGDEVDLEAPEIKWSDQEDFSCYADAPVAEAWYIDRQLNGIQYSLKPIEELKAIDFSLPENKDAAQNVSFSIHSAFKDIMGLKPGTISIQIKDENQNTICSIPNSVANDYSPKFEVTHKLLSEANSKLSTGMHYLQVWYNAEDIVTIPESNKAQIDAYTQNTPVTLGSTISDNKFSNAKGLRIAIAAYSKKGDDQEYAYEYAARTVLKFEISSGDFSKFKLMKYDSGKESGNVRGKWYLITWDLSAPTYYGFVAGDVPYVDKDKNAQTLGPKTCYAGECSWNPLKSNYILYPGGTLRMQIASGHNHGGKASYLFRQKNKMVNSSY